MPAATVTTTETFPVPPATPQSVQNEMNLRIQAGAINSVIDSSNPSQLVLKTIWNVIGQNGTITS
jgi:hypothetical protein